ncbi:von Willebrand factor C and EGF domain-containing protein-like [Achroia grisella]|uniref:von Willebrand factor C and EGF domain-containing protein-like n=1 Tax=Achroia grisella TaxID=688607 RepID=UPI0027D24253|nr:von Willebrand factor C and EGF domain-containing protein-like [Achroia grisella]
MGDGAKMTWLWLLAAVVVSVCAEPYQSSSRPPRTRHFNRGHRSRDYPTPSQFVGPNVCRTRNGTHCCPGWTSRPNSLLCVVPLCRPDCGSPGGSPGACIGPNMCRCPGGVEAPSCNPNGLYSYTCKYVSIIILLNEILTLHLLNKDLFSLNCH